MRGRGAIDIAAYLGGNVSTPKPTLGDIKKA